MDIGEKYLVLEAINYLKKRYDAFIERATRIQMDHNSYTSIYSYDEVQLHLKKEALFIKCKTLIEHDRMLNR